MRGVDGVAARLGRDAETLRERFEEAFWVPDQGYYVMAHDAEKRPADAIGSNAGHCLWTGIVSSARARMVADRLLGQELFSGWDPDLRPPPARLQPAGLPHGHGLAARHGADRGRAEALRVP